MPAQSAAHDRIKSGRSAIDWGVYGIPETFLIGRDGTILYKHVGPLGGKSLTKMRAEVEAAIAG